MVKQISKTGYTAQMLNLDHIFSLPMPSRLHETERHAGNKENTVVITHETLKIVRLQSPQNSVK